MSCEVASNYIWLLAFWREDEKGATSLHRSMPLPLHLLLLLLPLLRVRFCAHITHPSIFLSPAHCHEAARTAAHSTQQHSTPVEAMPRSSGLVLALAASAAALRDSRVTPCPLYTPKITLNQPPRVATLAMG